MPDGTTKKYRRRYISKCNVILKKPSMKREPTDDDMKYEEVPMDENVNENYNPEVCLFPWK